MSAPIPIVLFVTSLAVGGTERQIVRLVQVLPKNRFEPHVVALVGGGLLEQDVRNAGGQVHNLDYQPMRNESGGVRLGAVLSNLSVTTRLARILRNTHAKILHTHLPVCNVLGWIAAKQAGLRRTLCTKVALGHYRDTRPILARAENFVDPRFALIHCKSRGIAQDLCAREPVSPGKIRVVYNGIDVAAFQPTRTRAAVREAWGVEQDDIVVLTVANLIPYKGHLDILAAASELRGMASFPNVKYVFVGRDDGIQAALQARAVELGISDSVRIVGPMQDVAGAMAASELLLSASHEEGFSNVLLEAMASGLPVIATTVGGNSEAVADGETGLLVEPRNPYALRTALESVIADQDRRRTMGDAGNRRVRELFSQDAMRDGMIAIYEELLAL